MNSITLQSNFLKNPLSQIAQRSWYNIGRMTVDVVTHILYHLDVVYKAPLPAGAKLLSSNHPTTIDPVIMTTLVPEQVSVLINEILFKVPVLGKSLAASGHIPVLNGNGRQALEDGIRCLKDGRTVGIFPEGDISPREGGLARFHTGAARLVLSTGVPVIPVGIALAKDHIKRINTIVDGKVEVGTWYFHGPYAITVGNPMFFKGDPDDRAYVREITAKIAGRITELSRESGQRLAARQVNKPVPVSVPSGHRHGPYPGDFVFQYSHYFDHNSHG